MTRRDPLIHLDAAYAAINALGGEPIDEEARIYNGAIGDALFQLEKLGALDPFDRRTRDLEDDIADALAREFGEHRRAAA